MVSTIIVGIDGSVLARNAASTALGLLREPDVVVITMVVDEVDWSLTEGDSGFGGPVSNVEEGEGALIWPTPACGGGGSRSSLALGAADSVGAGCAELREGD